MILDFMMVVFMMVDFMMVVLDLCFPTKTLLTQCVLKETEILFLDALASLDCTLVSK